MWRQLHYQHGWIISSGFHSLRERGYTWINLVKCSILTTYCFSTQIYQRGWDLWACPIYSGFANSVCFQSWWGIGWTVMYDINITHHTLTNKTVVPPAPITIPCPATTGMGFQTQKICVHGTVAWFSGRLKMEGTNNPKCMWRLKNSIIFICEDLKFLKKS